MSIRIISQFLSNIPLLRHRDTVNPNIQADKDDFVVKYEATNDHLANTTVAELNTVVEQINNTVGDMILAVDEVEANAMIVQSIGNYQGVWNSTTAYLKNQSVSIENLFYTAKANNTNISPLNTDYWLSNPINNKLNTNISTYDEKTTPINADLIPLCDSADAFAIKKLSWANLKATLSNVFVSKISSPTANSLVKVNEDGSISNSSIKDINGALQFPNINITGNVLDWYETGSFLPIIKGNVSAGTCIYNVQSGEYVRIGDICFFSLYVAVSSHTGQGDIIVSGLPFYSSTYSACNVGFVDSLTFSKPFISAYIFPESNFLRLTQSASNTYFEFVQMDTSFQIIISGSYKCQ